VAVNLRGADDIYRGQMRRTYFVLMGICLTLFLLAGLVVRNFSRPLAIAMTAVAMVIPPIAVILANAGRGRRP
jgi:uncharacterized integral membrane protein